MAKQVTMLPNGTIVNVGDYPKGRALPVGAFTILAVTDRSDGWQVSVEDLRTYLYEEMKKQVDTCIEAKYGKGNQLSMLFVLADAKSTEAQKAQVGTVWTWINAVLQYYAGKKKELSVAGIEELCSFRWDFSVLSKEDAVVLDDIISAEVKTEVVTK